MKKLGCGVMFVGLLALIGSFVMFGTAVRKVVDSHRVTTVQLTANETMTTDVLTVTTDKLSQIGFDVEFRVKSVRPTEDPFGERGFVAEYSFPYSYTVFDGNRQEIYSSFGNISSMPIEFVGMDGLSDPGITREGGEKKLTHFSPDEKFQVTPPGEIRVEAEIGPDNEFGAELKRASLVVWDNVSAQGGSVFSGIALLFIGPMIGFVGGVLFLIGLLAGKKESAA